MLQKDSESNKFSANGVSTSTFQVCSHAVTLKKNIPTYDIRELRENAHWMSATTIIPNRSNSINCVNSNEQFSMESMCNGVLNKLKYFSDYVPNTPTMPGKASFSWAAVSINLTALLCNHIYYLFPSDQY